VLQSLVATSWPRSGPALPEMACRRRPRCVCAIHLLAAEWQQALTFTRRAIASIWDALQLQCVWCQPEVVAV
jgi:hypothetical protein